MSGWTSGMIVQHRQTYAQYKADAGSETLTLLNPIDTYVTYGSDHVQVQHTSTVAQTLSVSMSYMAMFGALPSFTAAESIGAEVVDVESQSAGNYPAAWANPAAARRCISMLSTPGGAAAVVRILAASPGVGSPFVWRNDPTYRKLYFPFASVPTTTGATFGATWRLEFRAGPLVDNARLPGLSFKQSNREILESW